MISQECPYCLSNRRQESLTSDLCVRRTGRGGEHSRSFCLSERRIIGSNTRIKTFSIVISDLWTITIIHLSLLYKSVFFPCPRLPRIPRIKKPHARVANRPQANQSINPSLKEARGWTNPIVFLCSFPPLYLGNNWHLARQVDNVSEQTQPNRHHTHHTLSKTHSARRTNFVSSSSNGKWHTELQSKFLFPGLAIE